MNKLITQAAARALLPEGDDPYRGGQTAAGGFLRDSEVYLRF